MFEEERVAVNSQIYEKFWICHVDSFTLIIVVGLFD